MGGDGASSSLAAGLSEAAWLVPVHLSVHPSPSPPCAEPSRVKGQARGWGEFTLPLPDTGQTWASFPHPASGAPAAGTHLWCHHTPPTFTCACLSVHSFTHPHVHQTITERSLCAGHCCSSHKGGKGSVSGSVCLEVGNRCWSDNHTNEYLETMRCAQRETCRVLGLDVVVGRAQSSLGGSRGNGV